MGLETQTRLEPQVCFFIFIFITIDCLQIDLIVQKGAETTTTETGREWGVDDDNGGAPGMFLFSFLYILLIFSTSSPTTV